MPKYSAYFSLFLLAYFCLPLSFFGGGDKSHVCDEARPATSFFRPLPSDTVNLLPHSGYSQPLQRLFDQARGASKTPIRFTQLPKIATDTSLTAATTRERIIALRVGMDHGLEENAIAHELFHLILQDQGFAALIHVPVTRTQLDELLPDLGGAITSCVDDVLIDRRMARLGFDPKTLNHDSAERFKQHPPPAPTDPLTVDGNALMVFCFAHRLKAPADEVEATWMKISPDVVRRSRILAKKIGDIRCEDAGTCLSRKQHIRDVLGYPLTFCNPASGRYE